MLRRIFLENWTLKVIAAALAVILYVYVQGERQVTTTVTPRLVLELPADMMNVTTVPDRLKVVVTGPWSAVSGVTRRDVPPVEVDLTGYGAGPLTYYLDEEAIRLPPGLRITSIIPAALSLDLEATITRKVHVVATVRGEPAAGFHAGAPKVIPSTVALKGAESDLSTLTEVTTEPVDIEGATADVTAQVRVLVQRPHVSREKREPVTVTVPVIEEGLERRIDGVAVEAPGGATVHPDHVSVTVRGPHTAVERLEARGLTARVPADALPGPGGKARVEVELTLPKGVRITGKVPQVEVRAPAAKAPAGGPGAPGGQGAPGANAPADGGTGAPADGGTRAPKR